MRVVKMLFTSANPTKGFLQALAMSHGNEKVDSQLLLVRKENWERAVEKCMPEKC